MPDFEEQARAYNSLSGLQKYYVSKGAAPPVQAPIPLVPRTPSYRELIAKRPVFESVEDIFAKWERESPLNKGIAPLPVPPVPRVSLVPSDRDFPARRPIHVGPLEIFPK